jgi:hypothetical protein
MLKFGG